MNNFDCIFVNGDSYSASNGSKVYADWLADQFNVPVKNFAVRGCCNQRILRSSIEYLDRLRFQYQNPLVLISWTFVHRVEVWYHGNNQSITASIPDQKLNKDSKLITLDWLLNSNEATLEHKALTQSYTNPEKALTDFYTNLYLLANFLESKQLTYRFFSAADNHHCRAQNYPHVYSMNMTRWVLDNPNIYKLQDFSLEAWAKAHDPDCDSTGHLSANGHQQFAKFMSDVIIGNNNE